MNKHLSAILITLTVFLFTLSACTGETAVSSSSAAAPASSVPVYSEAPSEEPSQTAFSPGEADAEITLEGSSALVTGSGAKASGSEITISSGGTYNVSGTLTDGRIIVDAGKAEVIINLAGADIACSYSSPVYIYSAGTATINLAAGTNNSLTDGQAYSYTDSYSAEAEEEPNACLYSKDDLVITGSGSLTVNGNFGNGITSKDSLEISGSEITVNAANHGINGKDYNSISGAVITVSCQGDAIRSTNDTDSSLGYVTVKDSQLTLNSGEDSIQAQTDVSLENSTINIVSGGGSSVTPGETSAKGIKADGTVTIDSGTFTLDCSDDGIHASNVLINSGSFTISTGDDGMHADDSLTVSGGTITVNKSYEGLEATEVNITGGEIYITSSDDGINAAGGADGSGSQGGDWFGGMGGMSGSTGTLNITGGYVVVDASGDGLDANGDINMGDGTVIVFGPENSGNGALDYDGSFNLTGGTLIAAGAGGMAQSPNNPSQNTLSITFDQIISSGEYISLYTSDGYELTFKTKKSMQNIIISSPDLETGTDYTVSYGGTYSGADTDGISSGGTYSGGTTLTTLTISDTITTYGTVGIGGSFGGGRMGGPEGNPGQEPGQR